MCRITAIAVFTIIAATFAGARVARAAEDGPVIPPPPAPAFDESPAKAAQKPAHKTTAQPTKPATAPAKNGSRSTVIAPVESPDATRDDSPPGPAARRQIPEGLRQYMQPDGTFLLPGGVGIIDPKEDHVGVQINTPVGVFDINVPRRQRMAGPDGPPDWEGPFGPRRPDPGAWRASREFAISARIFATRNYPAALERLNRFLDRDGGDHELMQLRSLTNFMLADYPAAYRDALAATTSGDVWDWPTLSSLYPSVDEYTAQFHALGKYVSANPNSAQATFLLAYHNLMLGYQDVARREFGRVAALDRSNETARRLAAGEAPAQPRQASPPAGTAVPQSPPQAKPSGGPAVDLGQPEPITPQKTQSGPK